MIRQALLVASKRQGLTPWAHDGVGAAGGAGPEPAPDSASGRHAPSPRVTDAQQGREAKRQVGAAGGFRNRRDDELGQVKLPTEASRPGPPEGSEASFIAASRNPVMWLAVNAAATL